MRKALLLSVLLASLGALYALLPLWTAFEISRALKAGDAATLEARVDWPLVRASLKTSLAELEQAKELNSSRRGLPRPSLWSRIKAAAVPVRFADTVIDRYLTPAGLAKLVTVKGGLGGLLQRQPSAITALTLDGDGAEHLRPLPERLLAFWSRLKRVTVLNATAVEVEVQDRRVPERAYIGTLELRGLAGWQVTQLRVVGTGF